MSLNTILKWFGLDVKKPLDFLLKALGLLDKQKLVDDVQKLLCLNMSAVRKKDVAAKLMDASTALTNNDCAAFAKVVAALLEGIKL